MDIQTDPLPSPAEVHALRRLPDPDNILIQMKRLAKDICAFVLQQENMGPPPGPPAQLIARLLESGKLPPEIRIHVETIQRYADLIDHQRVQRESLDPALGALHRLTRWVTERYHVAHASVGPQDPFELFWLRLAEDWENGGAARLPDSSYELYEGRRRLTPAGAVYRARHPEDQVIADLFLLPVDPARRVEFMTEVAHCQSLGDRCPLPIQQTGTFDVPEAGEWRFLLLAHPDRCTFESLCKRFMPLPERVGLAMLRETVKAFESLNRGAPAFTHSLFRLENLTLNRTGAVQVVCDWDRPENEGTVIRTRDEYWFCRRPSTAPLANDEGWFRLRGSMVEALRRSSVAKELLDKLDLAGNAMEAAALLVPPSPLQAEDSDVVRVAVECWFLRKDLPTWVTLPESPAPDSSEVVQVEPPTPDGCRPGLRLADRMMIDCLAAWPLSDSDLLVWQSDNHLAIIASGGSLRWRDEQPTRVRCVALGAGGRLAVGGWGGELRWFCTGRLVGEASANWTIGDLQPFRENWLAGSWNGHLFILNEDGSVKAVEPAPEDGVCRIAVSKGERFATLSMRGVVSIYQRTRAAQTKPLQAALSLAFAGGILVVLTEEGLVIVDSHGVSSRPDRLPARGTLRLLAFPPEEQCLLVNDLGPSWIIDGTGTYPRGPTLAPRIETVGFGFRRCTAALESGGYAYWKDGSKVRSWTEALAASISSDGVRLVVVLPGAIEVYEDLR